MVIIVSTVPSDTVDSCVSLPKMALLWLPDRTEQPINTYTQLYISKFKPFQFNSIFLPTPQLLFVLGGKEVGGLLVIILVLKEKTQRNRKSTTCAICWLKPVLHEEKCQTGSDSRRTNATKTVLDVFRHRSGTGKSYCRTRSDVGSESVEVCKSVHHHTFQIIQPTGRNNFSGLLLDVYVWLNMFRASSHPSSGAQQLQ